MAQLSETIQSTTHRRWAILALLFLATVINFVDRQTLSILAPTLRSELHLTDADYANVVTAFLAAWRKFDPTCSHQPTQCRVCHSSCMAEAVASLSLPDHN